MIVSEFDGSETITDFAAVYLLSSRYRWELHRTKPRLVARNSFIAPSTLLYRARLLFQINFPPRRSMLNYVPSSFLARISPSQSNHSRLEEEPNR